MPVVNNFGDMLMGVGNTGISIDKHTIRSNSGTGQWLNDNQVIYQDNNNGASTIRKYDLPSHTFPLLLSQGANRIVARNNIWAVYNAASITTTLWTGTNLSNRVPLSVGFDDTILCCNHAQDTLYLYTQDGLLLSEQYVGPFSNAFHYVDNAIYREANGTLSGPAVSAFQGYKHYPFIGPDNEYWVAYQRNGKAVAHKIYDKSMGFEFGTEGLTYNPCGVLIADTFLFGWSITQGESTNDLHTISLSAESMIDLESVKSRKKAFPRKILFLSYHAFTDQYGPDLDYPGNAVLWTNKPSSNPFGLPLVTNIENRKPELDNITLHWYVHGNGSRWENSRDEYEQCLALPEKPVIYYLDTRDIFPLPNWIDWKRTQISFPCYRNVGESLSNFIVAMEGIMDKLEHPFALTPQFYSRNFQMPLDQVLECIPLFHDWIHKYDIVTVMPFADMRPSGMVTYPELKRAAWEMFNLIPGRPNRFDYWLANNWRKNIDEKLNYTMLILRPEEIEYIREKLNA